MGLSKTSFLHNGHLTIPWLWEEEESCAKSGRTHEVLLSYSPQQRVAYRCPHVNLCKHPRKIKRPYLFKHHRNCTTSPRAGPKSFTCRTFGWISAWSASFKPNEFSMRSCYQKLTATLHQARLWNFRVPNSDFNLEVSKHHGPTGCPFIQLIMLEQCIMWQDGKTAKIQVVWHFILSRQTLGHGNG